MDMRRAKPIQLKRIPRGAVADMLAGLEVKPTVRRAKERTTRIWTEEFLASGKPAKGVQP